MNEDEPFELDLNERPQAGEALILDLDGFEGPLDLLLSLARDQKVDLAQISILQLADQYLSFVHRARTLMIEVAADYLVMAAWLAYLKSRLLLPQPSDDEEPSGAEMAAALAFQLQRLESMRKSGKALFGRPQLGRDFFLRGEPETVELVRRHIYEVSLFELLKAYGDQQQRSSGRTLTIVPLDLYSVDDALKRLNSLLGNVPDWQTLSSFLPENLRSGLGRRSAIASTFAASLELAKAGKVRIRQDRAFGPIYLRGEREES
ncbi:MAG: segregation/condensation protein A [Alphaproteobacteria bacterium]|nr:segregation/condensation protein A [Alphaproteobacteria bacterium]